MPAPDTFSVSPRVLAKAGLPSIERLCERAGVAPSAALGTSDFFRLWTAADEEMGDRAAGLRFGAEGIERGYGVASMVALHAPDFRRALGALARYKRLTCPELVEVEALGDEAMVRYRWLQATSEVPRLLVDMTMASLRELARRGTAGRVAPIRLELARRPTDRALLRRHFGCPVDFGAPHDAMVFDRGALDVPFVTAVRDELPAAALGGEAHHGEPAPRQHRARPGGHLHAARLRRAQLVRPRVPRLGAHHPVALARAAASRTSSNHERRRKSVMSQKRVLVTGGSGFIAGHCIVQLLEQDYLVRTTVRSLGKEAAARAVLADAGMVHGDNLSFVAADLMSDEGWAAAVADVDFVLHVASPVQPGHVENEEALIKPAREGALRVLRAARAAGVKRVVLTSAFHAVSWGHPHGDHTFTEKDWTILDGPGVDAYGKSKTLAERAAWDFMAAEKGSMELSTMLPVAVMGPVMGKDISGSNHIIKMMLEGAMPGFPNLFIPIVDVRDVATAHIQAMTAPGAAGERFLLSSGPALAMKEIGATIKAELGEAAGRVPTRSIPDFVVRLAAVFNAQFRQTVPDLGYAKKTTNEKARRVLGWTPRDPHQAIVAAAGSMVRKDLVKK